MLVLDCEVFPKSWKSLISISVITGEAPSPICDSFWNPIFSCFQTFASKKLTGEARKIFAKSRNLVSIFRIISLKKYIYICDIKYEVAKKIVELSLKDRIWIQREKFKIESRTMLGIESLPNPRIEFL